MRHVVSFSKSGAVYTTTLHSVTGDDGRQYAAGVGYIGSDSGFMWPSEDFRIHHNMSHLDLLTLLAKEAGVIPPRR